MVLAQAIKKKEVQSGSSKKKGEGVLAKGSEKEGRGAGKSKGSKGNGQADGWREVYKRFLERHSEEHKSSPGGFKGRWLRDKNERLSALRRGLEWGLMGLYVLLAGTVGYHLGKMKVHDYEIRVQDHSNLREINEDLRMERNKFRRLAEERRSSIMDEEAYKKALKEKEGEWQRRYNEMVVESEYKLSERVMELEKKLRASQMGLEDKEVVERRQSLELAELSEKLPMPAFLLCRSLMLMEGISPKDYEKELEGMEEKRGWTVLQRLSFLSGSTRITYREADGLKGALRQAGGDALLVVACYSGTTGDAGDNRRLGLRRAGKVVSILKENLNEKQKVYQVYIGETARFSQVPNGNNVVELWWVK